MAEFLDYSVTPNLQSNPTGRYNWMKILANQDNNAMGSGSIGTTALKLFGELDMQGNPIINAGPVVQDTLYNTATVVQNVLSLNNPPAHGEVCFLEAGVPTLSLGTADTVLISKFTKQNVNNDYLSLATSTPPIRAIVRKMLANSSVQDAFLIFQSTSVITDHPNYVSCPLAFAIPNLGAVWTAGITIVFEFPPVQKLANLIDVNVTIPSNNDVLTYNTGSSAWIAAPVSVANAGPTEILWRMPAQVGQSSNVFSGDSAALTTFLSTNNQVTTITVDNSVGSTPPVVNSVLNLSNIILQGGGATNGVFAPLSIVAGGQILNCKQISNMVINGDSTANRSLLYYDNTNPSITVIILKDVSLVADLAASIHLIETNGGGAINFVIKMTSGNYQSNTSVHSMFYTADNLALLVSSIDLSPNPDFTNILAGNAATFGGDSSISTVMVPATQANLTSYTIAYQDSAGGTAFDNTSGYVTAPANITAGASIQDALNKLISTPASSSPTEIIWTTQGGSVSLPLFNGDATALNAYIVAHPELVSVVVDSSNTAHQLIDQQIDCLWRVSFKGRGNSFNDAPTSTLPYQSTIDVNTTGLLLNCPEMSYIQFNILSSAGSFLEYQIHDSKLLGCSFTECQLVQGDFDFPCILISGSVPDPSLLNMTFNQCVIGTVHVGQTTPIINTSSGASSLINLRFYSYKITDNTDGSKILGGDAGTITVYVNGDCNLYSSNSPWPSDNQSLMTGTYQLKGCESSEMITANSSHATASNANFGISVSDCIQLFDDSYIGASTTISVLVNKDLLVYDSGTTSWINQTDANAFSTFNPVVIGPNTNSGPAPAGTVNIGSGSGEFVGVNISSVNIGTNAGAHASSQSVNIGYQAGQAGDVGASVNVGSSCGNSGQGFHCVAVGFGAGQTTQGDSSICIGNAAGASGTGASSICIGISSDCSAATSAVAIGDSAEALSIESVSIGRNSVASNNYNISIGSGAQTNGSNNAIAIGQAVLTTGLNSVSCGSNNTVSGNNCVALGSGIVASVSDSILLGLNATTIGTEGVSIYTAGSLVSAAANVSDAFYPININGVVYKLLLKT